MRRRNSLSEGSAAAGLPELGGAGKGENIVIVGGEARIAPDHPPADQTASYVEKYAWGFERLGVSVNQYASDYSTPILIALRHLRTYY